MELGPKRGTQDQHTEIRQNTVKENKSYHTAWTYMWILGLTEVDLEGSTKSGTNRTEALVSLH